MSFTVYEHVFPNGKKYVGITCQDVRRRWRKGQSYHQNTRMFRAIKKYGWENIEHNILATDLTEKEAEDMEVALIRDLHLQNPDIGYNIADGGNHPNLSEETKRKIGAKTRNNRQTEEFKRWISQRNSGAGNYMYGRHHSEETKRKISESKKGHSTSPSKGKFGGTNPHAKSVVALDPYTGAQIWVFPSILEAGEFSKSYRSGICAVLAGKQKVSGGYAWKYAED